MADTLNIFGTEYSNVAGIIATTPNETDLTYIRPQGTKNITQNGSGIDVTEYASVDVSVSGATPNLQIKSASYTPSLTQQTDSITADSGYDGLETVNVTVNAVPTANWGTASISATKDSSHYKVAWSYPNFVSGYVGTVSPFNFMAELEDKTVTPNTSTQTVAPTDNYSYLNSVTVNAMPSGSVTAPSTITGSSATVSTGTNTLTLSKTVSVTPSVTTAGYVSSGTAGNSSVSLTASVTTQAAQTIYPSTSDQTITGSKYLTGTQTIKGVTTTNLTADNIKSGVTVQIGDSADSDRVASVTGTYTGSGGTSKNVQVNQSTTRTSQGSLTKVNGDVTVSKTGTYDVYWTAMRSATSSGYTWGSQLYVGGSAYGTENTTWSNHVQNNHLSNVSLTADQKIAVYTRGRTGSYYTYAPMLVIVEA